MREPRLAKFLSLLSCSFFLQLFYFVDVSGISLNSGEGSTHLWSLQSCGSGSVGEQNPYHDIDIPAQVPGEVHVALIKANVLTEEDPLWRFNEVSANMKAVAKNCWMYVLNGFDFGQWQENDNEDLLLTFEKIDTAATVYLNGHVLGVSQNAHRPHTFRVPSNARVPTGTTGHVLRVEIRSALSVAANGQDGYPYAVPHTLNYNVWTEPSHRNFIRKAGSDFGWDWGPAYVPAGLGSVTLRVAPVNEGFLDALIVQTEVTEDLSSATMSIFAHFDTTANKLVVQPRGRFQVYVQGKLELDIPASQCKIQPTSPHAGYYIGVINIPHDKLQLWWPRGHGEQPLYTVQMLYSPSGRFGDKDTQSLNRRVGLRRVRLVQIADNDSDNSIKKSKSVDSSCPLGQPAATPASFYLEINEVPIFMRGANFIPLHVFGSLVTKEDRKYLLDVALQSNMNMLRVWGGGTTQPDDLYDMADEYGILLWQELLFACAMYPSDTSFLHEVSQEVQEHVRRLSSHASVVIFGGNNENEVALYWFTESQQNRDLFVSDYSKLYGNTAYPALISVASAVDTAAAGSTAGQFAWVDSSPSAGLLSSQPYAKRWSTASTAAAGDVHFYDYDMDCEDYTGYPQARFISEFGFQGQPSFLAYKEVSLPEDWQRESAFFQFRQRHENGDEQMRAQLAKHFMIPPETSNADDVTRAQEIDNYLYLLQVQQARCYETAIGRWRQLQTLNGQRHTMGILYWQLNDIWQGPSWASMENSGRWRVLQYAAKRAFSPLSISFSGVARSMNSTATASTTVSLWVINDRPESVTVHVSVWLEFWQSTDRQMPSSQDSNLVWTSASSHNEVSPSSSMQLTSLDVSDAQLSKYGCTVQTCYLKAKMEKVSTRRIRSGSGNVNDNSKRVISSTTSPIVPDAFFWLTSLKDANLATHPVIQITDFHALSSTVISFSISVDVTSPFLWLELRGNQNEKHEQENITQYDNIGVYGKFAGFFSDNGFLAEANQVYKLQYTQHRESSASFISESAFKRHLFARVLQNAVQNTAN